MANRFIKSSNLPESDVTLCVCSDAQTARLLALRGINVLSTKPTPHTQHEVCAHADMQICHLGGKIIIADEYQTQLALQLTQLGFEVETDCPPQPFYPDEIRFNAAVCGRYIFGLESHLSKKLKTAGANCRLELVNIRQGYAKCSVCPVTERAIITDDCGISRAAKQVGFGVLEIEKGDIFLTENHCGFIGGCSGKLSKNTVAFTGSLDSHRDGERIRAFLCAHGCTPVELAQGKLKDIGGILPLKESLH